MPFLERQFFTQMTVERREVKIGKPLLTGSALCGDEFRNICDVETILSETDVLIENTHFPSLIHIAKIPISKVLIANKVDNTRLWLGESTRNGLQPSSRQFQTDAGWQYRVKLFILGTVANVSLLT